MDNPFESMFHRSSILSVFVSHIGTDQFVCFANQLTSMYITSNLGDMGFVETLAWKWVIRYCILFIFFFHTIKLLHLLKQSCSFQLHFCLSMCDLPIFFNVVKYQRVFFHSVKRHLNIKLSSFLHNHQSFCIYILILIFNNISVSKWT